MRRAFGIAVPFLVLTLFTALPASAQLWEAGLPGDDVATVTLDAGAIIPTTTLPDGSSADGGLMVGGSATWWAGRHVGFRGHIHYGQTEGVHGDEFSAAAYYAGDVWAYGGEAVLRYPMADDRLSPYVAFGPGGKSYRWSHDRPRVGDTAFAWNAAVGVGFRPAAFGPLGVQLEGRYLRSTYYWHGMGYQDPRPSWEWHGPTVNDLAITAGVSLNW